jgi:hypothetical protein
MADAHDQHDQFFVRDFIDDPVVSDSESAKAGEFALQDSSGKGFSGQPIDCRDDSPSIFAWDSTERSDGALFNLD